MSYAYVYAPKSGTIWSLACYCRKTGCNSSPPCGTGCDHKIVGGSGYGNPIDLGNGWTAGTDILFRGSSNILSIYVTHINNVCSGGSPAPWTYGVKVDLYTGYNKSGTLLGTALYGHLQNRLANGTTKNKPTGSWAQYLGEMPSNCACGCSDGIHVHMESKGASRNSLSCEQSVTTSTWFYRWVMPV